MDYLDKSGGSSARPEIFEGMLARSTPASRSEGFSRSDRIAGMRRSPDSEATWTAAGLFVLVFAPIVCLLGAFLYAVSSILRVRWFWLLGIAILGIFPVLVLGPDHSLHSYEQVYRQAWAAGSLLPAWLGDHWRDSLFALLPLSVTPAAVGAAAALAAAEHRRPSWKDRRGPTSSIRPRLRRRRNLRCMQVGRGLRDGTVLGLEHRTSEIVTLEDEEACHHVLVVGATGAGKTTVLRQFAHSTVRRGLAWVLVDMKGDPALASWLEDLAATYGRSFHRWSLEGPEVWNPLTRGDATELKDKLIGVEEFTEPHYKRAAERFLQRVFTVLHAAGDRRPTLSQVVRLLNPAALDAYCTDRCIPDPLAAAVAEYVDTLSSDQKSGIRGLQSRLATLTESTAGRWLEPQAKDRVFDLHQAVSDRAVVLFSIESSRYAELAKVVGSLVVQDLKTVTGALLWSGNEIPAYVAVDEFSALDGTQLLDLLARGRSSRVAVLLCTQEVADLRRTAPAFCDQVLGVTATKVVLRQDVPTSAELFAQVVGTIPGWEETIQVHSRSSMLGDEVGGGTGLGSVRQVESFLVHPNELKQLRRGEALLIRKFPSLKVQRVQVVPVSSSPVAELGLAEAGNRSEPVGTAQQGGR